jgi:diacylglycerol kinase family enzyme
VLKLAHIQYILAFHLQVNADPDQAYHVDADPVRNSTFKFDANPDADPHHPQHWI